MSICDIITTKSTKGKKMKKTLITLAMLTSALLADSCYLTKKDLHGAINFDLANKVLDSLDGNNTSSHDEDIKEHLNIGSLIKIGKGTKVCVVGSSDTWYLLKVSIKGKNNPYWIHNHDYSDLMKIN